jgi:hypothetical protein
MTPAIRNESSTPGLEMARARVYGLIALGQRDGAAFRDRIVGAEAAGREVARGGLFDRSNQVKIPSARRSDTPPLAVASGFIAAGQVECCDAFSAGERLSSSGSERVPRWRGYFFGGSAALSGIG